MQYYRTETRKHVDITVLENMQYYRRETQKDVDNTVKETHKYAVSQKRSTEGCR